MHHLLNYIAKPNSQINEDEDYFANTTFYYKTPCFSILENSNHLRIRCVKIFLANTKLNKINRLML